MQPYIFPYLGYYQLVHAVDTFVFDDVNFIMKGWINRNRILQQNEPYKFTIPLVKASQNKLINEIEISDYNRWKSGFLKIIEHSYKKAPQFSSVYPWLTNFFGESDYTSINHLASSSISSIAELLNMNTNFLFSSDLDYKLQEELSGEDKILRICEILAADEYVNPKNGVELYDADKFAARNINLKFIYMDEVVYHQAQPASFTPALSIIDVLMFNSIDVVKNMLNRYTLKQKSNEIITGS